MFILGEQDEKIHKQEAVCRLCFNMLREDHNVLKTKCKCQFTLMHTECALQYWSANKCGVCNQHVQTIPVTISVPSTRPKEHPKPIPRPIKMQLKPITRPNEHPKQISQRYKEVFVNFL